MFLIRQCSRARRRAARAWFFDPFCFLESCRERRLRSVRARFKGCDRPVDGRTGQGPGPTGKNGKGLKP